MRRRAFLAAALFPASIPAQQMALQQDQWQDLARVWNPFAEKMNRGVFDLKLWQKVVKQVERIEGKGCRN